MLPAVLGRVVASGGARSVATGLSRGSTLTADNIKIKMDRLKKNIKAAAHQTLLEYGQGELQDVQMRIASRKTDPYARRWAPWSFATRQQRTREGTAGRGLLFRTGALHRSFRMRVNGSQVTVYSTSIIARYLAQGRPNMRPRVLVDLGSKLSQNRFRKILSRNLKKAAK